MTKTLLVAAFTFLIAGTPAGAQQSGELIQGLDEHEHSTATARDPDHPGANHFYIHAVEASGHPEWALPSAQRLAAFTPWRA